MANASKTADPYQLHQHYISEYPLKPDVESALKFLAVKRQHGQDRCTVAIGELFVEMKVALTTYFPAEYHLE